jgi:hypothetical protein
MPFLRFCGLGNFVNTLFFESTLLQLHIPTAGAAKICVIVDKKLMYNWKVTIFLCATRSNSLPNKAEHISYVKNCACCLLIFCECYRITYQRHKNFRLVLFQYEGEP